MVVAVTVIKSISSSSVYILFVLLIKLLLKIGIVETIYEQI